MALQAAAAAATRLFVPLLCLAACTATFYLTAAQYGPELSSSQVDERMADPFDEVLNNLYRSRCLKKTQRVLGAPHTSSCPTPGTCTTGDDCFTDDTECVVRECNNAGSGCAGTCQDVKPLDCGTFDTTKYSGFTCSAFGTKCALTPIKPGDLRLLQRCVVQVQDEQVCGQPSYAGYIDCLRTRHMACFDKKELDIQQERWVTRTVNISDACKICADDYVMGRRRILQGFANLKSISAKTKSLRSLSAFDDMSNVRDVLEMKLCNERLKVGGSGARLYEPQLFALDTLLHNNYNQCVKQNIQGNSEKMRADRFECQKFVEDVLTVDHVFGRNYKALVNL